MTRHEDTSRNGAVLPEPKKNGKWIRFDRRTFIFVKDGQDVNAVIEKYRNRPCQGMGFRCELIATLT